MMTCCPSPSVDVLIEATVDRCTLLGPDPLVPIATGSRASLLGIAAALEKHAMLVDERVAVDAREEPVRLWNPRRRCERVTNISRHEAEELARRIRRVCSE